MTDRVRVCFDYYPDESELSDPTGMSEAEYDRLMDALAHLGADDVQIERVRDDT